MNRWILWALSLAVFTSIGADFSRAAERLYKTEPCSFSTAWFGFSTDDVYTVPEGLKVTRANITGLKLRRLGHGDARVTKAEGREVIVHRWMDLFGDMDYQLEIYVEER